MLHIFVPLSDRYFYTESLLYVMTQRANELEIHVAVRHEVAYIFVTPE